MSPRSLKEILDEYLPPGQEIHLLNADVEGYDLGVPSSNDSQKYRPKVIVAELLNTPYEEIEASEMVKFLRAKGYLPTARFYNSLMFQGGSSL